MKHNITIGIDIGGTGTVIGIVDEHGKILNRSFLATPDFHTPEDFFHEVATIIRNFPEINTHDYCIKGIGIGAPNGNFYKGTIEFAPNLKWKGVIQVTDILQKHFPELKIRLTNDANAAAMGEMIYGHAKGERDFIMITLGTGVGSGIVCNGQLIYGHDGFAGEIGHTIFDPEGRQCGCGRKGCLETYASAGGIVKTALELLQQKDTPSVLRQLPQEELTARHIGDAALQNDPIALETFYITAKILGIKLADSVAHTSPSTIYIFGGVANAGDVLLKPLKYYFEEYLLQIFKNKINIKLSALPSGDAAILGAAALINYE